MQQQIALQGNELVEEWCTLQSQATLEICLAWFDRYREVVAAVQLRQAEASRYRRRRPADSQLDPERSLAEQSTCCRWWTTSAIRPSSTGAAGATCCRCGQSPNDPLSPWQPNRHDGLHF
mgnify:CR=1 FL=1